MIPGRGRGPVAPQTEGIDRLEERPIRSVLFVPANRDSWVRSCHRFEADAVVLDLEDATPHDQKAEARAILNDCIPLLRAYGQEVWVRVNELNSPHFLPDLEMACCAGARVICAPKMRRAADIVEVDRAITDIERAHGPPSGSIGIYPHLETAEALYRAREMFDASRRIGYGGGVVASSGDVALSVGFKWTSSFEETLYIRSAVLLAARAAGIMNPLSGLVTELNTGVVRRFAEQSRAIGYAGNFVIHPTHVRIVNEVFTPSEEEFTWSQHVLESYEAALKAGRGTFLDSKGRLVDIAMVHMAERVAARYRLFAKQQGGKEREGG